MNTSTGQHHHANDARADDALSLYDVLPVSASNGEAWTTIDFALRDAGVVACLRREDDPHDILARALALITARLTGTDIDNAVPRACSAGMTHTDACSAWSLHLDTAPARLQVAYRAPLTDVAIDILERCVIRALAHLATRRDEPFDVLDSASRRQIAVWNATALPRRESDTVHDIFAAIAMRHPGRAAVESRDVVMSYCELHTRSTRVAANLIARGVAAGDMVAMLLPRSTDAIVALLGILKAGAAYLPLDAGYPVERLAFVLADAGATLVIAPEAHAVGGITLATLEASVAPVSLPVVAGDALAYAMYTSGSTGAPKGAMIEHRSIIRLVRGIDYVQLGDEPRVLHAAPLGFDASTFEIFAPLLNGGTCIVHDEAVPTGCGIESTVDRHGPTIAWLTAALFNAIVDEDARKLRGLRQILTGGEALSPAHIRKAYDTLPDVRLVNGYGPTECTTFATTYAIPRDLDDNVTSIPIGRAIADTTLHVLNACGEHVPIGVAGELYIGGAGVARGYLGHEDLTAERFVTHASLPGQRLYRTGDRVRWQNDGALQFIGRLDSQVKIRGYRIEPGEIEAALQKLPGVRACAVLARTDRPGTTRLVAYVVGDPTFDAIALRRGLASSLPEFMVPAIYIALPALPVTANGKLDRRALPAPDTRRPELSEPYAAPVGPTEASLCALFADLLGVDTVGRHDHFFDLGGHSLLATQAIARIHAEVSTVPSIAMFFGTPTPAGLAAAMAGTSGDTLRVRAGPESHPGDPVAIIAMAGRFPGAADVEAFWDNLCAGRESITFFDAASLDPSIRSAEREDPAYVAARGLVDGVEDFDAGFFGMSSREADLTDPQQRLFLEVCWECMERAGYVPGAHDGPVGIFGGMHNATYFQRHLRDKPWLIDKLGAFQVMLANEKDYLTTRVAHKLNLTGPAISLNTACSTSLVALAQAVDSLRAGRCEMALAGGVSITCPPRSGYISQEGSMLSPDGHTRSFDADAQGTVFSDGVAVVLLKRLADALRDGDPIHAVVRGAAVNNDGGNKASFTAPSSAGQASVIAMALADAGVDARSISYVEAHGTATPLGDPIELEGLTRAFRGATDDRSFCAIGSLKSNVGHMVMAAGVAGVIKTALALSERHLPASINFRATNPRLDFAGSPFTVQDHSCPWHGHGAPRRAGVSSFGVGGTNAHVILEESPPRAASTPASGAQLLLISARSSEALSASAFRLANHLTAHPRQNLADVAFTLTRGRKGFSERAFVVACDAAQGALALDGSIRMGSVRPITPRIVFLFPGQGAQYAGMGRALHAAEPVFRNALDACADYLLDDLGFDLREPLFLGDADALRATSLTQPATFAIEYALAQLWISYGVTPVAMIGHSVGEFVAAAVAGVMTWQDAARLVARRGRLMQAMVPGAMMSVRMDATTLAQCLPANVSLAAENAPQVCVVAGPADAVDAFRETLEADGAACRLLHTSHAFHSSMMDPVLAPFASLVGEVTLRTPNMPIVSTLTGKPLTDAEAISPSYWARHLREPVRFSTALEHLLADDAYAFVEVGPRATLTQLARQHGNARAHLMLPSLADNAAGEHAAWLAAVGQLWCAGAPVDVQALDRRAIRHRVRLPTYPFERRRHWIEAIAAGVAVPDSTLAVAAVVPAPVPELPMASLTATTHAPRVARLVNELTALFEDVAGNELDGADTQATFVELGLDSLALTQVALQLQRTFALKITFRELMENCATFERLAHHIDRLLPPEASAPVPVPSNVADGAVAVPAAGAVAPRAAQASGNLVQDVIAQQMQIMQQQLALLAGTPTPVIAAAAAAPAPVTASPTPASASMGADAGNDDEAALAHTTYDVKKAFGAIARIHNTSTELSARQRARLDAFMRRYTDRTRASKAYTQTHRTHLADPRVVNGFRPLLKEMIYQLVVDRSRGSRVWDIDGNEYVDALNGFGMNLFGWQPDFVIDAVRRQLDAGYEIGPQHPLAGIVAQQICELTGFERAGLCNTGSEAVMGTVRIARTVTGRDTLVIFTGSYHGIFDEVIVRGTRKLRSVPAAPGILRNTSENVLVLEYGTAESLAIIRERAATIAAVLVEPVQSRRPDFQPREFLQELRAITRDAGALLIFDEVVTGFRSHPRGAQAMLGIDADLAAYGKVVGGGFPIGVIAGKRSFMDALDGGHWQFGDASIPTVGVTYFAGTFVRHPLALAAAHAVLTHLAEAGGALQQQLNARTTAFIDELNAFSAAMGAPIKLTHFSSVWKVNFLEDHPLQDLLFAMMRSRGVHVLDNFPCFFTTAHSDADFAAIARAFKDSVLELQEAEFLPRRIDVLGFDADRPPQVGARLGKDAEGQPAWFMPHPELPGKFVRVDA